jgi:hypothetical protein
MCDSGLATFGYFYLDSRDRAQQNAHGLLSSLLIQLCAQADHFYDTLSNLYSTDDDGSQVNIQALAQCLEDMLRDPKQGPVYIVVDALDECPNLDDSPSPRNQVLQTVKDLIDLRLPHLHFCVTSRPEPDIQEVFRPLKPYYVSLHDEDGHNEDIFRYIKSVVDSDSKMQEWQIDVKKLVINTLAKHGGL